MTTPTPAQVDLGVDQLRRIPADTARPVLAYHLDCPCGWSNMAIHGRVGITEADGLVTIAEPFPCGKCKAQLAVTAQPVPTKRASGGCCRA